MKHHTERLVKSLAFILLAFAANGAALAGQLSFSQVPAGAGGRDPAPNIIVSVDDSGSMGAAGMATLKAALTQTFAVNNVEDGKVRLAWNSMNTCRSLSIDGTTPAGCGSFNGMRPLQGAHRTNFMNWVNNNLPGLPANTNLTPSHQMMRAAGEYLKNTGLYGPFRKVPGSLAAGDDQQLSCRKSFNIFMTDGAWNTFQAAPYTDGSGIVSTGGNSDGITRTLPDSIQYSVNSNQTTIYRDTWGTTTLSTLSDLAFDYWATDLQPLLNDDVAFSVKQVGPEVIGATSLSEYWNPKNNPAKWQSMVTYTIGFNALATSWLGGPTWTVAGMHGGPGYVGLVNGTQTWTSPLCAANGGNPDNIGGNVPCDNATGKFNARANYRSSELWHMALNSRGKFYPAPNAAALVAAFKTILDDINAEQKNALVSISTNSSRLGANGYSYVAGFSSAAWNGSLKAYKINTTTSIPSTSPSWSASTLMDTTDTAVVSPLFDPDTRVVLTHNGTQGAAFRTATFSASQKDLLTANGTDNDTVWGQRVSYLRGTRTLEVRHAGGYLRNRDSRLGDIANSNIWFTGKPLRMSVEYPGHATFRQNPTYAGRTPTLYVGANDGMLHAFNANNGRELMAYVPRGVYNKLRDYTLPTYSHKYFVDGSPFTGDANLEGALGWRTVLVSGLGAGGKGYFILDVSNPSNFSEANASGLVLAENTETSDPDIGHIFSTPTVDDQNGNVSQQIVKLNNGHWAVIMGNGYNSVNERPVLLIQYLHGARTLTKIEATTVKNQGNGLSSPRTVDVNGDGTTDLVYAGDLMGNLWKFDLTSSNETLWGVSDWNNTSNCDDSGSCAPLYVARSSANQIQPITSAPMWMPHPLGGVQVLFGTGQLLTQGDRSSTVGQTIYSIWDKSGIGFTSTAISTTHTSPITTGRSALVAQTITSTSTTGVVSTSKNAVPYSLLDSTKPRGWYFDLPYVGQRVISNPIIFERQLAMIGSMVPQGGDEGETCSLKSGSSKNYISILNMISGSPPASSLLGDMDSTGNGSMLETGTGEGSIVTDMRNQKSTLIDPEYFCEGPNCKKDLPTTCTGTDCSCNGPICTCTGPSCTCTGPGCRTSPRDCGNISTGLIDLCRSGLFGTRADWRELR